MKEIIIALITALITAATTITTTWITQVSPRSEAIAQLQQDVQNLKRPPQTLRDDPSAPPFFQVLSVQHKNGSKGEYFDFDAADLDAILGRKNWNDTLISVSPNANGAFREARVLEIGQWRPWHSTRAIRKGAKRRRLAFGRFGVCPACQQVAMRKGLTNREAV